MEVKSYLDLLSDVLANGEDRPDRTGTGTLGVFARSLTHDLAQGFPLLTTKRVWFRGVVEELLWMAVRGSVDVSELEARGVQIWTPWKGADQTIGHGYGKQFRQHMPPDRAFVLVPPRALDPGDVGDAAPHLGDVPEEDVRQPGMTRDLYREWQAMHAACADPGHPDYKRGGKRGLRVCRRWHDFSLFLRDAPRLPQWHAKREDWSGHVLDAHYYSANGFGPTTCAWLSRGDQALYRKPARKFVALSPDGHMAHGLCPEAFALAHGLKAKKVRQALRGERPRHRGYRFAYLGDGETWRKPLAVDQVAQVLESLRQDPYSRRHVISLWNPADMGRTALPCCHGTVIQFYADRENRLSCHMYQRSGDIFLGVPWNIAFYALLTHMFAHVLGMGVGTLTLSFGDLHIYQNHVAQVREQLGREPRALPRLVLNPDVRDFDAFTLDDIRLENYTCHDAIPAPVSV